jgi:hypothetical protein
MQGTKKWYESTTIQGGIVSILVFAVQLLNIDLDAGIITEFVTGLFGLIGLGMVIWGRLRAKYVIN